MSGAGASGANGGGGAGPGTGTGAGAGTGAGTGTEGDVLLDVRGLRTYFFTDAGVVRSVDGVSFRVRRGETLALVGESGCGKSVTSLSIMRLVASPPGRIVGGEMRFRGTDLATASEPEMQRIRGNQIAMIFQEPMTSLNPVFTVGDQVGEAITLHRGASREEARRETIELFRKVGIPSPELRVDSYPHEMSGGMKQRVMIAMALACTPDLLIADEPTTALDVTIQAQILELVRKLQSEMKMAVLFITHDLGVVAEMAHQVAVMYAGKVVERGSTRDVFKDPLHPYTQGLFRSLPVLGKKVARLDVIQGTVPNPLEFPSGCKFHTRCPAAGDRCTREEPALAPVKPGHDAACWIHDAGGVGAPLAPVSERAVAATSRARKEPSR
jgi:peptide/nickel transport system ATP-binding protein/oligopeptide transport system ATP-binding protein